MNETGPAADAVVPGFLSVEPALDRIQIVIAEDEALYRDLLSGVLAGSGRIEVLGAYPDAETTIEATRRLQPHVVVLDIELEGNLNGIQAGLLIRREFPDVGIVWLSAYRRPYLPVAFQHQTATGWAYLLKKSGTDVHTLAAAIQAVAKGLIVLDPAIADSMNRLLKNWTSVLSPAEYDVLALMAQGFGNTAIAQTLQVPEKSVESQINQIYNHLRLSHGRGARHRRVEAVLAYMRAQETSA
ncbi:MAG TPA: response regulator transcription factor [bacterium]|nr:response regulator transcription factor [bacterium]